MTTPWINFREMKKITTKQNKYIEWTYQTKIADETSLESTSKGDNNLLDKIDDTSILVEESILTDLVISHEELPVHSETTIEEENDHRLDIGESLTKELTLTEQIINHEETPISTDTNVKEKNDHHTNFDSLDSTLTEQLASDEGVSIPRESNVEEENDHPLNIEKCLSEEQAISEQVASNEEPSIATETTIEEENDHPLAIEKSLPEKQAISEQVASNEGLPIPLEPTVEENDEHFQHIDEDHGEDLTIDQIASNQDFAIPSESNGKEENDHPLDNDKNAPEEQDSTAQADSNLEFPSKALTEVEHNIHSDGIAKIKSNNPPEPDKAIPTSIQGEVYTTTQKSPFSTYIEITDFLHAPIYGENVQKSTFEFLDLQDNLTPQLETKLFHTIMDYPEQLNYRLVRSNINQMISLMRTDKNDKKNKYHHLYKTGVVPLHNTQTIHKGETNTYSSDFFIHIRVPVVLGEYKIEICMEEYIAFDKGIKEVKEITNEVVLSDCRFVPIHKSQTLENETCTVLKGNLFIKGYIQHNIEYTVSNKPNETDIHPNQLCQNIVIELVIHLLQVQKIKILFDRQGFGGL